MAGREFTPIYKSLGEDHPPVRSLPPLGTSILRHQLTVPQPQTSGNQPLQQLQQSTNIPASVQLRPAVLNPTVRIRPAVLNPSTQLRPAVLNPLFLQYPQHQGWVHNTGPPPYSKRQTTSQCDTEPPPYTERQKPDQGRYPSSLSSNSPASSLEDQHAREWNQQRHTRSASTRWTSREAGQAGQADGGRGRAPHTPSPDHNASPTGRTPRENERTRSRSTRDRAPDQGYPRYKPYDVPPSNNAPNAPSAPGTQPDHSAPAPDAPTTGNYEYRTGGGQDPQGLGGLPTTLWRWELGAG